MNEPTPEQTPVAVEPKTPKKRAKSKAPRAPRVIDPGVAAIRQEALAKVAEYRAQQASAKALFRLTEQCLKLTKSDRATLMASIQTSLL